MSTVAVPAPEFAIGGVEADPFAATPILRFATRVTEPSGREVYTIALTTLVRVDAHRRPYDEDTRERLRDIFGEGEGIPATAGSLHLGRVDTLVPSFTGDGSFTIDLPVSADLELAGARYLTSLPGGMVPLDFGFNGSIFFCGADERLQVTLVPWSASARFRMRAEVWHELLERRHAGSGFVRLQAGTLDALRRRRADRGLPTFDATIAAALEESA